MNKEKFEGKNQSYNRIHNNSMVISYLKEKGIASATTLSSEIGLSNAALSSILKDLSTKGLIRIERTSSKSGKGRKQIDYVLNGAFGLIVAVSISNYLCTIAVSNIKEEILIKTQHDVPRYDASAIYQIVLEITKIIMEPRFRDIPLKNIIISLPGLVNSKTGELAMSPQFDPEIFATDNFIVNVFSKQFPSVPVYLANDVNLSMIAEAEKNGIAGNENAMLVSIDAGIGGAFVIGHRLFEGDTGFAGEFGLLHGLFHGEYLPIDEFVSLRSLCAAVSKLKGEEVRTKDLIRLYGEDETVKKHVLETASVLGKVIHDIILLMDIKTVVLSGRVSLFGEEYLEAVKKEFESINSPINVEFSKFGNDGIVMGAISKGVNYILDKSVEPEA